MRIKIPKTFSKKMTRYAGKVILATKKHLPDILIALGIISGGAATVTACVETLKIDPVLDKAKDSIDEIHEKVDDAETVEEKECALVESKKELTKVYIRTAGDLAKLYWPAFTLGALSVACILSGHGMMLRRNAALAAAYTSLGNAFNNYRKRVVEEYGTDVDHDMYYGTKTKTVIDSETGEVTKVKEPVESDFNDYVDIFDSKNPNFDVNPDYCRMILVNAQSWANDVLEGRGHIFLNEIYEELGMPLTKRGQVVGWVKDDSDGNADSYVDLRIEPIDRRNADGTLETDFIIDPNVDGVILNKFERMHR